MTDPAPPATPRGGLRPRTAALRRDRKPRRGRWVAFAVVQAGVLAGILWFATRGGGGISAAFERVPEGATRRVGSAAAFLGVLALLCWIVAPLASRLATEVAAAQARLAARRGVARVVLFPVRLVVGSAWFAAYALFAVDVVLVLLAAVLFLLAVVRVIRPDLFPWMPG